MFAYELPIEPSYDIWEEQQKPFLIMEKLKEICEDISSKGDKSHFSDIVDLLYEHIQDNLEQFLPQELYDH
jgi:hypothetical protein